MSTDLNLTVREEGRVTVVAVEGELDAHTAPRLREALLELVAEGRTALVLDLGGVSFLDSTALGVLVAAQRRTHALDGYLDLVTDRAFVAKLLRITAIDSMIDRYDTVEQALAAR